MSAITKQEAEKESEFMTLFWKMIKEFYIPEDDDDYWTALVRRGDQIYEACGHSELGKKLMVAFANYLDEKWREGRNEHI